MRIRWSDEAVAEMFSYLNAVQEEMNEVVKQARTTEQMLQEANPDSDNKALNRMQRRFEDWEIQVKRLQAAGDEFCDNLKKAQKLMDEAEATAIHLAENLSNGQTVPFTAGSSSGSGHVHYTVFVPQVRTGDMPMPDWLNDRAAAFDRQSFME